MFDKAIMNVSGAVPFNPKAFPMVIALGDNFIATQRCETPDDVPRDVDFVVLSKANSGEGE